jgi:hypothetical protein
LLQLFAAIAAYQRVMSYVCILYGSALKKGA